MKRFFKPIEKDGSFKKQALSSPSPSSPEKASEKPTQNAAAAAVIEDNNQTPKEPSKFLTWNANSLLLRIKNNWKEFSNFVENLDPDVIAIQEVRMPAAGSKGKPRNPREIKDDTTSSRDEKLVMMRALSSGPFKSYNVWWSLSDSKYAGTALFIKKCVNPIKVSFSLDQTGSKHEPDGRVILAEFESFRLLNTYVPNNGWKEEESSFQRRRKWDKRMSEFVLRTSDKPLIWCGDLNVSHQDIDVSHPEFFSAARLNGYVPPNKEDCGQPGFTLSERMRFGSILKEYVAHLSCLFKFARNFVDPHSMKFRRLQGSLVDAYRYLHKDKDMEHGFSWSGNPVGKYRGKRMRIDYFLVSEKWKQRIVACESHGHGIELEGFYGSDHCPVSLELSQVCPTSGD